MRAIVALVFSSKCSALCILYLVRSFKLFCCEKSILIICVSQLGDVWHYSSALEPALFCLHMCIYLQRHSCVMVQPGEPLCSIFGSVWVMGQGESLWLLNRANRIIMRRAERLFLGSREPVSFIGPSLSSWTSAWTDGSSLQGGLRCCLVGPVTEIHISSGNCAVFLFKCM